MYIFSSVLVKYLFSFLISAYFDRRLKYLEYYRGFLKI